MRRTTIIAAVALSGLAAAPPASADYTPLSAEYLRQHTRCDQRLGDRACGRNIVKRGVRRREGVPRAATAAEKARSVRTLRRMLAPPPVVRNSPQDPGEGTAGASGGGLGGIAACESGGDPTATSPDGTYTGLYQFDDRTWQSVGGSGRAKDAPPAEQHRRAEQLHRERGSSPWPNCG